MWWIMPRAVDLLAKNLGTMRVGENGIGDAEKPNQHFPHFPHTTHVWYIYLHLVDFYGKLVGKYTVRPS